MMTTRSTRRRSATRGSSKAKVDGVGLMGGRLSMTSSMLLFVVVLLGCWSTTVASRKVTADCGLIKGYRANNTDRTILQFLGIPYASPPVGDLRWKQPVSLQATNSCWSGVLNARTFGNYCVQPTGEGSEDCLYLNIWTPMLQYKNNLLPVLFYIHGGGFNEGSGGFNGATFVDEASHPIVLVSINYRLNGFGFMALSVLSEMNSNRVSGNYGIGDMIAALKWTQAYIAAFGGDPNRITIAGQSSGGTGVLALLISPLAKNLFHGAILMSASTRIDYTLAQAEEQNQLFFERTNCSDAISPVDCLYNMTSQQVIDALPWDTYPYWGHPDDYSLPVPSRGDGAMLLIIDGQIITDSALNVLSGNSTTIPNDVPSIFGTMEQENDAGPGANLTGFTIDEFEDFIYQSFSVFSDELPAQVLDLYNITTRFQNNSQLAYETITSDIRVTCGQTLLAQLASTTFTSPVYRYVVTQRPSSGPVFLSGPPPAGWASRYAFHLFDLFSVFDIWNEVTPSPPYEFVPDENDILFGDLLRDYFSDLITTGVISSTLWPTINNFNSNQNYTVALLQLPIQTVVNWRQEECKFWFDNGFYIYSWNS